MGSCSRFKILQNTPSSETLILEEKESVTSDERVLRNLQNVGSFDIIHIVESVLSEAKEGQ